MDEISVFYRPRRPLADVIGEAEAVYRSLAAILAGRRASFENLTGELLFLSDIRQDLPLVLETRARVLRELGLSDKAPAPAFIGQAPVPGTPRVGILAAGLIPHQPGSLVVRDLGAAANCGCAGCARSGARFVRFGGSSGQFDRLPGDGESALPPVEDAPMTALYSTNLYGVGSDAHSQVLDMFAAAERLLERCGMGLRDVVRTWIYLRDIGRDYDALNAARREVFRRHGIECRPASTGVQGVPFPAEHDFALRVQAIRGAAGLEVTPMSTPNLNEAWSYGVDFSRGLRISAPSHVTLHVSGTASLDAEGQSVHPGDIRAQVDRMLDNIESLLARQGASFADVVSGTTYLKDAGDVEVLAERCRHRGYVGFPCAIVQAELCRPELLCEAEAVALLPFATPRA